MQTPKFRPRGITPTAEQSAIQCATQREILIQANAGAAKTTTLALRIAESLVRGVPAQSILALTMTEAARDVMQQRLIKLGVPAARVREIRIATFEQLAHQILQNLEGSECPVLPQEEDLQAYAVRALEQVCDSVHHPDLDANFTNLAVHQFLRLQENLKARLALPMLDREGYSAEECAYALNIPLTGYHWYLEYEALRGAEDWPEFRGPGDASFDLACRLLQQPDVQVQLPQWQMVLCDEMHDLNEACCRILLALVARGNAFFCGAGDRDQVIYGWRGADHSFMQERLRQAWPRIKEYPLTACFRYGDTLAQAVSHFKRKANTSMLGDSTAIHLRSYATAQDAGVQCVQALRAWLQAEGEAEEVAILLREPGQSVFLEAALALHGHAWRVDGMESFLLRLEVLAMRGMLAAGLRNLDTVKLKSSREAIVDALLTYAEVQYGPEEYQEWKKSWHTLINQPQALDWFFEGVLLRQNGPSAQAMRQAWDYLRSLAPDTPAAQVLQHVYQLLQPQQVARRLYLERAQADSVAATLDSLQALAAWRQQDVHAFCAWLGETEWQLAQKKERHTLTLATVDAIKGKEYPCVILPFLAQHVFPRKGEAAWEEENRFYVAITRAQQELWLLTPAEAAQQSPYLARLQLPAQAIISRAKDAL
ncbi:ATP-dependent helicase [Massilia sp. W12]|uniref:ATP-dependent helicase n=1 Tax=Massilia sp. W12 TaxID=3126507 RepID=UPI0030CB7417